MKTIYSPVEVNLQLNPRRKDEVSVKFSDLQDFLKDVVLSNIRNLKVTDIPTYRFGNFDETVSRYIFNKFEIEKLSNKNKDYEYLIFG